MDLKEKIRNLPLSPGVYIMKSKKGEVLYVGKASSLKKRVSSYLHKSLSHNKTALWVERIETIDFIVCNTEAQALILEASLIKEKNPKYNIALRDDKSYPYVEITQEDFPRIFVSRPKAKSKSVLYGPYVKVKLVKEALKLIRKIFPYRSCKNMPTKPCLFYHLNLCPAPCIGRISYLEYKKIVGCIHKIISGDKKSLIDSLEKKMNAKAREGKFEEAAFFRDRLIAIYNLYSGKLQLHQIVLLKELLKLPHLPLVIEAIDISTLGGREAAGSVVVFKDGLPDKSSYRRYKIKGVDYQNDYGMIAQVVKRRYSRLKKEAQVFPQLIIVDGGKAHVNRAKKELRRLKLNLPVIGIAKKNEEVWLPKKFKPVIIPKDNPTLHLIQRIRDEAHRFAHKYHSLLRKKKMI